jgi:hypothetical protein
VVGQIRVEVRARIKVRVRVRFYAGVGVEVDVGFEVTEVEARVGIRVGIRVGLDWGNRSGPTGGPTHLTVAQNHEIFFLCCQQRRFKNPRQLRRPFTRDLARRAACRNTGLIKKVSLGRWGDRIVRCGPETSLPTRDFLVHP